MEYAEAYFNKSSLAITLSVYGWSVGDGSRRVVTLSKEEAVELMGQLNEALSDYDEAEDDGRIAAMERAEYLANAADMAHASMED